MCAITGVVSFINGGKLGAGFGLVTGLYEGYQHGLWREPARLAGLAGGRSLNQALQFAGYLGVYTGGKCTLAAARGVDDLLNAGLAGCAAGSVGALRTRNPAAIVGGGFIGGGMMMVVESLQGGGASNGAPDDDDGGGRPRRDVVATSR